MIKVLLVDDTKLFREAIRNILEHDEDIHVVACASDGNEAIECCDRYLPDIVLMDIIMPVKDGVESTRLIKEKYGWIKIIMLTASSDNENIRNAMKNGADGYVLKDVNPTELILTIKSAMSGLSIIDQNIYQKMVHQFSEINRESTLPDVHFTERETEIIKLIGQGKRNKEIADILFLTQGRVKNIITDIMQKLGCNDRVQIAIYAVRKKLV
ncbi:MAG: response regulator transcription factor [Clostridiaceae bacterium]|jgi:DNA-binding NarL/FixJ family response regulator|nr:response regulator transcription factor [Clostridiaceae bacterium]